MTSMIEGKEEMNKKLIGRLHSILRPFLLRRLKRHVAKQLPAKVEHTVMCRLSKRQRQLYEDFISRSDTRNTMASGNFMGMMNVLMQLRKVCNHPDIFAGRPIISPFDQTQPVAIRVPRCVLGLSPHNIGVWPDADSNLSLDINDGGIATLLLTLHSHQTSTRYDAKRLWELSIGGSVVPSQPTNTAIPSTIDLRGQGKSTTLSSSTQTILTQFAADLNQARHEWRTQRRAAIQSFNVLRSGQAADDVSIAPMYGQDLIRLVSCVRLVSDVRQYAANATNRMEVSHTILDAVQLPVERLDRMLETLTTFTCIIPRARAPPCELLCSKPLPDAVQHRRIQMKMSAAIRNVPDVLHPVRVRQQIYFPDKRLLQFDCGKLQMLDRLLRQLRAGNHRGMLLFPLTSICD
jgi:SNF2 family DNA or RNA helicase